MALKTFLINAKIKGFNKRYVFFKDKDGTIKNICFQDGVFFTINSDKTVRFLNPILTMETLIKIQKRELKIVGSGMYVENVNFEHYQNREGKRRAWRLS